MEIFKSFDYGIINSPEFKEDSVREEIIAPILKELGYSAFGENKIVRSQNLKHPYIYFGTKKENITIIPDYLLQVNGVNVAVIDAKSPRENILKGKNPEQAYSYAIHKEIRVNKYGLCNGNEIAFFDVNEIEPIFYSEIQELEEKWEEFYKVISPLGCTKPYIFNFKPDFGIRLMKTGWVKGNKYYFLGTWLNNLGKLDESNYTFVSGIPYGGDCLGSFDFHRDLLDDFISQIPENKKKKVINALTHAPFRIDFSTEEDSFEVAFQCELGDDVYNNENEIYCPLKVTEFLKR
ncbi:MAG: hypothetical protein H6Q15_2344 [Bacteroidetes bacterium]|nr:hypothetical protein [Bacteroidota bacterium]